MYYSDDTLTVGHANFGNQLAQTRLPCESLPMPSAEIPIGYSRDATTFGDKSDDANKNSCCSTARIVGQLTDEARTLNDRLVLKNNTLWDAYGHARKVLTRYKLMHELEQCHKELSLSALQNGNPAGRFQLIERLKAEQSILHAIRTENSELKLMLNEYENTYHKVRNEMDRHRNILRALPEQERNALQHYQNALAERVDHERSRRQALEHYACHTVSTFEEACRERVEMLEEGRQTNRLLAAALDVRDRVDNLDYLR